MDFMSGLRFRLTASIVALLAHDLVSSANNFLETPIATDAFTPFGKGTMERMERYGMIIQNIKDQAPETVLTGRDKELKCSWDGQFRNQLDAVADLSCTLTPRRPCKEPWPVGDALPEMMNVYNRLKHVQESGASALQGTGKER